MYCSPVLAGMASPPLTLQDAASLANHSSTSTLPHSRYAASALGMVAPMPRSPTTLHDDLLERTTQQREPCSDVEEVVGWQTCEHFRYTGTGGFARLLEMLRPSRGERQDDATTFLGILSTVHQLALHQTIDVDRGGRPGNPQVLGHAGEGRPGHAAQEGEHTKLGDGQRGSPAGAHLRADKVHHEGDRLHHLLGTKLRGDYRCRWWFHHIPSDSYATKTPLYRSGRKKAP